MVDGAPLEKLESDASDTILNVPGAPQSFTATAGDTQVTLGWAAPSDNGGSAITGYQYRHSEGSTVDDTTATWTDILDGDDAGASAADETGFTVTSLTNGTEYAFEVRAVNAVGGGTKAGPETATPLLTDTSAPTLGTATVNGTALVLTYNEALDEDSEPATSAYEVTVAGSTVSVSDVSVSGMAVTLTLGTAAVAGQTVSLNYTVPASNPVQDTAGNDAAALTDQAVTNNTPAAPGMLSTLVSNTGQGDISGWNSSRRRAQRFTTGAHANDYTLSSVEIVSADAEGDDMAVSVCTTDASGYPTSSCWDLDAPTRFAAGTLTFDAPAGTPIVLKRNTAYTVLITSPGGQNLDLSATFSDDEDTGGAAGWMIANSADLRETNWQVHPLDIAMKIAIKGTARITGNTAATGAPGITGFAQVGQTLTAYVAIADIDGLPSGVFPAGYTLQWVRVDGGVETEISGETSQTYTLGADDLGKTLKVKVSFTDRTGDREGPLTSIATGTVRAARAACEAGNLWCAALTVGEAATDGSGGGRPRGYCGSGAGTDVCAYGALSDNDFDIGTVTYTVESIRWASRTTGQVQLTLDRDFTDTSGLSLKIETHKFDILNADRSPPHNPAAPNDVTHNYQMLGTVPVAVHNYPVGLQITVQLTQEANTTATGKPTITGTVHLGETLTANMGDIADDDGLVGRTFPDHYTFQWVRFDADGTSNRTVITGATSRTYTLEDADAGKTVRVEVSFTDNLGYSETRHQRRVGHDPERPRRAAKLHRQRRQHPGHPCLASSHDQRRVGHYQIPVPLLHGQHDRHRPIHRDLDRHRRRFGRRQQRRRRNQLHGRVARQRHRVRLRAARREQRRRRDQGRSRDGYAQCRAGLRRRDAGPQRRREQRRGHERRRRHPGGHGRRQRRPDLQHGRGRRGLVRLQRDHAADHDQVPA